MSNIYKVGEEYKAKSYIECGYNFPEGKYKIKAIIEGFPKEAINDKDELQSAKEQWLEGVEDNEEKYNELYEGIWYYLEFPGEEHYEWIPECVIKEVLYL